MECDDEPESEDVEDDAVEETGSAMSMEEDEGGLPPSGSDSEEEEFFDCQEQSYQCPPPTNHPHGATLEETDHEKELLPEKTTTKEDEAVMEEGVAHEPTAQKPSVVDFCTTQKAGIRQHEGLQDGRSLPLVTPFVPDNNYSTSSSLDGRRQLGEQFESMSVQILNSVPSEVEVSSDNDDDVEEWSHHHHSHQGQQAEDASLHGIDKLDALNAAFSDVASEKSFRDYDTDAQSVDGEPLSTEVDSYEQTMVENDVENTGSTIFRDFGVFLHDGFFGCHDEAALVDFTQNNVDGAVEEAEEIDGGFTLDVLDDIDQEHASSLGFCWHEWLLPIFVWMAVTAPAVRFMSQHWDEIDMYPEPEQLTWMEWLWSWAYLRSWF